MQSVRKRILCVEDDEDSSGLMTALFELLNYQVVIASTSAEGLRVSQNRSFDCVTPILFLSADVYPETQAEAFSAGAKAYLTKPVDPDVLKEMVRWLLDERTAGASR
jgi:DNA-binding response OmpR family regulator